MTPLHMAAETNTNPDFIAALLDAGADPNARDNRSKTPWDYAQNRESLEQSDAYWRLNEARCRQGGRPSGLRFCFRLAGLGVKTRSRGRNGSSGFCRGTKAKSIKQTKPAPRGSVPVGCPCGTHRRGPNSMSCPRDGVPWTW